MAGSADTKLSYSAIIAVGPIGFGSQTGGEEIPDAGDQFLKGSGVVWQFERTHTTGNRGPFSIEGSQSLP
jgi:hypothetical protein